MKRLALIMAGILFFMNVGSTIIYAEEKGIQLAENAKSAILIERDTGTVLYEKNIHEKLPPASMTKIMTMLLIMEAIDQGKLSLDEKVRTSEHAASMGGSQIFLEPGETMTVDELLHGIAIASANDASVALAERIAGSEEAFVKMMNDRAKELGLKNTKFQNATGLPAEDHYSTAYDMAMMAKELLKHEKITEYTGKYESYLRENSDKKFWLVNTNRLVKFYPGVDGLKTGYTSEAKYCLTATAAKDGMRVIAVVFGAPTTKERNAQISKMLDYAFSQFQTKSIYKKNEKVAQVKVSKGNKGKVSVVSGEPVSLLSKKGEKMNNIEQQMTFHKNLKAPIQKGEVIGKLVIKKDGKVLSESELVAGENIKLATWWQLFKRSFGMITKLNE
jgi:serine-type D-Ala-D-Ala carboxypeptidase (penicillin-binding protein 5/6)